MGSIKERVMFKRFIVVIVILLGVCIASMSCINASPTPAPTNVLMVGDSLGTSAAGEIIVGLNWRYGMSTTMDVRPSTGLQINNYTGFVWVPRITALMKHNPQRVVVELGTNDALVSTRTMVYGATITTVMGITSGRPTYWVNVMDCAWSHTLFGTRASTINKALRTAATRYPNLHVVDAMTPMCAHPEYFVADHLHLTDAGKAAFAELIISTVGK